jgi:broad specificity phosphatase PhoE
VGTQIVFETHATTVDNELGRATGWLPGELSATGRVHAAELGERRRRDGLDLVLTSDLHRAVETVRLAFADALPALHDWRLRECDFGEWNGAPREQVQGGRMRFLQTPYPGGESWAQAVDRVAAVLDDVRRRWAGKRVLVVGHVATRWGLQITLGGQRLEDLATQEFAWQPGWEFELPQARVVNRQARHRDIVALDDRHGGATPEGNPA